MATPDRTPTASALDPAPTTARERLLALRRRELAARTLPTPALEARGADRAPATRAQRSLWFVERLAAAGGAYNTALAVRLRGPLERDALRGAFADLLRRQSALRARLVDGDPPSIEVEPVVEATLPVVALGPAGAGPARDAALHALLAEHAHRPFDLGAAPLVRALLVEIDADDHALLVVAHHVVCDGWSRRLIARELGAAYAARIGGGCADAPPAIGFADYAAWRHAVEDRPEAARALAEWRDRLAGLERVTVPYDRPPAADALAPARFVRFEVPEATVRALRALALAEGATPFMVLLAAFDVLLMRWSGGTDVAVGTPVAGRSHPALETLVGHFVDVLVLRTDLSGRPRFRELVGRTRRTVLDALERADTPLERVVDALGHRRDAATAGTNPLFGACLALHNLPAGELALPGLACAPIDVAPRAAKFDLSFDLTPRGDALDGSLEYAADRYDATTAARLAAQFVRLLAAAVDAPDAPVGELPMLADDERHALLETFNDTASPFPDARCVHELIAEQARATPDAVAVVCDGRRTTYAALEADANRLAHRMRALGVGVGDLVGVGLRRSERAVVAMLAAMKAGAGYLPLDPDAPATRLALVLADAAPRALVAEADLLARVAPVLERPVATIDPVRDAATIAAAPADAPCGGAGPRDLAYVLYTSGSTGTPKGVQIEHRGLVNNLWWQRREFGFGPADRFLARTAFTFDASCWELWTPLAVGATTVVVDDDTLRDPAATLAAIVDGGLTFAQVVPSFFALLLAELERAPRALPLRLMVVGGEALAADDVRRWWRVAGADLVNCYGPTETTIDATFERCPRTDVPSTMPIGRPIANLRALVIDPSGAPTPHGGVGELHVGGVGLARGYLNREALTAERFVPDPWRPGERLYRTGDLARVLPDGRLAFLGRADRQVKIRGIRIEPGEVEAAIAACPGVARAAVVVRPDATGAPRLVGYAEGAAVDAAAVRARLAARLPDAMLPSAIVALERFPTLASGKLDLAALPEPAPSPATGACVAPRSPLEATIAGLWAEVLGVPRIGAHDDFFAAGGNSLLAARAMNRLRAVTGVDPGLRALFDAPTAAGLAAIVAGAAGDADDAPPPVRAPIGDGEPAALNAIQQSLVFIDRTGGPSGLYNVVQTIRLRGPLDVGALAGALDALAARHGALRTRIVDDGDAPAQLVESAIRMPLAIRRIGADALDDALRRDAAEPFALDRAPLARATLFVLGAREHVLQWVIHHVVTDGWSSRLLAHELGELYAARLERRPATLATPTLRLVDHAAWQRARLDAPPGTPAAAALARRIGWWRERLDGLEPLPLPVDRAAGADSAPTGARVPIEVPAELAAGLRALAQRAGVTPFIALLAVFEALLARWCGHADVAVGTPVAGRDRIELEPIVGCLVDMVVVRTDLSGEPGFDEVLARVRGAAIDAFVRHDVPFDRLVAELRPQRERGVNPLFQVAFTWDDAPREAPVMPGLAAEALEVDTGTAKFPLLLALGDRDGAIVGAFEYRDALFERTTIETLAERFVGLLRAALADPSAPVGRLALQAPDAAARMLALGRGACAPAADEGIVGRFEAVARRAPDAIAIVDGGRRMRYAELETHANRLAHRLVALGVAHDEPVALCVGRSAEHVVAMLAILKAGAAYLPIDAELPADRIAFVLSDAGARFAVVDATGAALPAFAGAGAPHRVPADLGAPQPEGLPDGPLPPRTGPSSLAYVIYTSGSTGRPKGVRIAHGGVVRLVVDTDYVALGAGSVVAQASTCAFDAATFEIWGALLNGATLAIVPRATMLDADALAARIAADRIDTMFVTTALFNELVGRRPALFASMDTVLFGGEAADARVVRRVLEAGAPRRLLNVYGPTETTTFATWHDVRAAYGADPSRVPARVPIGRPIAGASCVVLDGFGALAPIGTVGELHVGGPGVALGYLRRPALDAERFVDDPRHPGARLYRTGDRVRWTADGTIEFVGRTDDQVKIRGFRIEIGEVESAVRGCAGVRDAAVVVHAPDGGDRRLVAFVVLDDAPGARDGSTARTLRRALRESLPEYMVPAAFVPLPALPLNANGKVDRRALPDPAQALAAQVAVHRLVRDAAADPGLEAEVARVWCEVLGTDAVGPEDDFFDLGGHSLLALRLLAAIERRFGRALPPATLFEAPTVRGLAAVLRRGATDGRRSCVVPVRAGGRRAPLFFMTGWGGALIVFAELARALGPDQPLYAIDPTAFDVDEIGRATLPEIAGRMLADIAAARPDGPLALAGFSLGGKFVVEIARQARAAGRDVPVLAMVDCDAPGYPIRRPLLTRIVLNVREALRQGPRGAWGYVADRLRWHASGGAQGPLFDADDAVAQTAAARAKVLTSDALLRLWRAFEPGRVDGRIVLVRAEQREFRPSVADDDPALGWTRWADGVDVRSLPTDHTSLLEPAWAPELARVLGEFLAAAPPGAGRGIRAEATAEA